MAGFLVGIGKAGEVAERSPAVISANLKEDMLLQKKRIVLERSARNLVHQIKVDQKVVYKNFQSRLVRSKLAFARLMGQKDIEKDLRAKNLGGLNTDIVGSADEEYSFLEKLEQRPCTATSISPRIVMPRKKGTKKANDLTPRSVLKTSKDIEAEKQQMKSTDERPSSATARVEDVGTLSSHQSTTSNRDTEIRPATTTGARVTNDFIRHQRNLYKENKDIEKEHNNDVDGGEVHENTSEISGIDTQAVHIKSAEINTEKCKTNENTDEYNEGEKKDQQLQNDNCDGQPDSMEEETGTKPTVGFIDELELDLKNLHRPRTVAITGHLDICDESPPISPKQFSRRASRASDFFQEEKKIDLVQLRLNAARSVDFTERVNKFCETLEQSTDSRNKPTADYYTIRLEASMKERMTSELESVPGTPDDENRRAMGNIHVRSLTVPEIDWNFEQV